MEQPALLSIIRTDTQYRFRLDLPDGPALTGQEYSVDLSVEIRERLRRALQSAAQTMQAVTTADPRRQTIKLGAANDALLSLGRLLFESLLPSPLQEALRHSDSSLVLSTNTPDIPWELMFDNTVRSGRYLCLTAGVGRLPHNALRERELLQRSAFSDRPTRKLGRRESQGLTILFLVNPTNDRPSADEEVAVLCTTLPEAISRTILYRQQANQLEMRMRINAEQPHGLHYAGPAPANGGTSDPTLALAGNSRLESSTAEQLLQSLPKRPLIVISSYEDERRSASSTTQQERDDATERLASALLNAGAGSVLVLRWPIPSQRAREFLALFYQDVADGMNLGEAVRRARSALAQHYIDD